MAPRRPFQMAAAAMSVTTSQASALAAIFQTSRIRPILYSRALSSRPASLHPGDPDSGRCGQNHEVAPTRALCRSQLTVMNPSPKASSVFGASRTPLRVAELHITVRRRQAAGWPRKSTTAVHSHTLTKPPSATLSLRLRQEFSSPPPAVPHSTFERSSSPGESRLSPQRFPALSPQVRAIDNS